MTKENKICSCCGNTAGCDCYSGQSARLRQVNWLERELTEERVRFDALAELIRRGPEGIEMPPLEEFMYDDEESVTARDRCSHCKCINWTSDPRVGIHTETCLWTYFLSKLRAAIDATRALEAQKPCCSICDTRKRCYCGRQTLYACSNCQIDLRVTVYVCPTSACRDAHEKKCPTELIKRLTEERARLDAQEAQLPKGFGWRVADLQSGGWMVEPYRLNCAAESRIKLYPTVRSAIDAAKEKT